MDISSIIKASILEIYNKQMLGRGAYQRAYPSITNPDIIYKVGYEGDLLHWVKIFKKYPDLFVRIYGKIKTTVVPIKNFQGAVISKEPRDYVAVEKVDTERFVNFFHDVEMYFKENTFQHYIRNYQTSMEQFIFVGKKIKQLKPELLDDYVDFINLIYKITKIYPEADLHKDQFGYDKNNKIKCFDI